LLFTNFTAFKDAMRLFIVSDFDSIDLCGPYALLSCNNGKCSAHLLAIYKSDDIYAAPLATNVSVGDLLKAGVSFTWCSREGMTEEGFYLHNKHFYVCYELGAGRVA